jgi:hypothetical protein
VYYVPLLEKAQLRQCVERQKGTCTLPAGCSTGEMSGIVAQKGERGVGRKKDKEKNSGTCFIMMRVPSVFKIHRTLGQVHISEFDG